MTWVMSDLSASIGDEGAGGSTDGSTSRSRSMAWLYTPESSTPSSLRPGGRTFPLTPRADSLAHMVRKLAVVLAFVVSLSLTGAASGARPGAAGVGDPYYPLDGNGGYDAKHYDLAIRYAPATDVLTGVVTIRARATQQLSAFNLDLDGLTIRSVTVDGRRAQWSRNGTELTVTPRRALHKGGAFVTRIVYDGVPKVIRDPDLGDGGAFTTADGVIVLGEPDVAQ